MRVSTSIFAHKRTHSCLKNTYAGICYICIYTNHIYVTMYVYARQLRLIAEVGHKCAHVLPKNVAYCSVPLIHCRSSMCRCVSISESSSACGTMKSAQQICVFIARVFGLIRNFVGFVRACVCVCVYVYSRWVKRPKGQM